MEVNVSKYVQICADECVQTLVFLYLTDEFTKYLDLTQIGLKKDFCQGCSEGMAKEDYTSNKWPKQQAKKY